jgi:heme oxygenase
LNNKLADLLKQGTKINHQQLEKLMVKQLRLVKTNEDYIKLLQLFYSYFGGLEDKINLYISPGTFESDFQRRKAARLSEDIKMLGGGINEKTQNEDLPQIENQLQAFGALYVLEGSTLGGRVIVKMLQSQMNTLNNIGFTFFKGYNDETEERWASFKELLNKQPQNTTETEQVVSAANETFEKFTLCFEKKYR